MTTVTGLHTYTRHRSSTLPAAHRDYMNARRIRIAASIAVPMLILLLPFAVYVVDRAVNSSEVARNVSIAGIDVGGLSRDDATEVVRAYETDLQHQPATFIVNGSAFELDPSSVGLTADVDGAVTEAMNQRVGGVLRGFVPWIDGFTNQVDVDLIREPVDPRNEAAQHSADSLVHRLGHGAVDVGCETDGAWVEFECGPVDDERGRLMLKVGLIGSNDFGGVIPG